MIPLLFKSTKRLWTPRDLPNLALWLDASDPSTVILNGGSATEWRDKSINSIIFSQSTASSQPLYNNVNGLPAITFDGVDDFLDADVGSNFFQENSSIFILHRISNYVSISSILSKRPNTIAGFILFRQLSSNSIQWDFGGSTNRVNGAVDTILNTTDLLNFNRTSSVRNIFRNGTQISADLAAGDLSLANTHNIFRIGRDNISTGNTYQGSFLELICITSGEILSTDNRQRVEGYLAHKGKVTANLANNHPYKNFPPRK